MAKRTFNEIENLPGESWERVQFDFYMPESYYLYVSNMGRIFTESRLGNKLITGINFHGYVALRYKVYEDRSREAKKRFKMLKEEIKNLKASIRSHQEDIKSGGLKKTAEAARKKELVQYNKELKKLQASFREEYKEDQKARTTTYTIMLHRIVAEYFCKKSSPRATMVIHLDYDKSNNQAKNLKWVTVEESRKHMHKSPLMVADKARRKGVRPKSAKIYKLTETKVATIKKRLNEGKLTMAAIAKQFKITETQVKRIKTGENWGDVKPA